MQRRAVEERIALLCGPVDNTLRKQQAKFRSHVAKKLRRKLGKQVALAPCDTHQGET